MTASFISSQLPNLLTLLRFPLTAVFLRGWFSRWERDRLAGSAAFLLAMLTDGIDGYLARHTHSESEVGAFLDPLADKALTISGFTALLFSRGYRWGWWTPVLVLAWLVIVIREVGITVLRSRLVRGPSPLATSWWGKWKTSVQMGTLIVALTGRHLRDRGLLTMRWLEPLVAMGTLVSALLAGVSGWRYLKAARNSE